MADLFGHGPIAEEQRRVDFADLAFDEGSHVIGIAPDQDLVEHLPRAHKLIGRFVAGHLFQQAFDFG